MEGHQQHHLFHQQLVHPLPPLPSTSSSGVDNAAAGDRFPQWSIQETREFLMIRAELDQSFMETKRNKKLWEVISNTMKDKGFQRSPDQCKCKWKNLVTRYKGCETMEAEGMRQQFPFYNELQAIFTARMQRMLWAEAEGGGGSSKNKKPLMHQSSEEEEEEEEESEDHQKGITRKKKKAKIVGNNGGGNNNTLSNLKEILEEFMRQQMQMEAQWMEAYEARENERRAKEMEWRQAMEALENEKVMMEQRWREREEQRWVREEARAERRDVLITALLDKLAREEDEM